MGQNSVSGHDGIIAIEKRIDIGTGTFTEVAEQMGTIGPPSLSRETNKRTPHKDKVPTFLVSEVVDMGTIVLDLDLLKAHATHDITDGFQYHFDAKTRFGVQWQGPGFVLDTTEDLIHSCRCVGIEITDGDAANPHSMKVTLQPDGPYKIDGTIKGASGTNKSSHDL